MIAISSRKNFELIDITDKVQSCVDQSEVREGVCHVFVRHATAAIVINENADPNIGHDFIKALDEAIPLHNNYLHDRIDNNAAAHIKAAWIGPSETIPIQQGKLYLGTWQSVMLVELDGPRKDRQVYVTCLSTISKSQTTNSLL